MSSNGRCRKEDGAVRAGNRPTDNATRDRGWNLYGRHLADGRTGSEGSSHRTVSQRQRNLFMRSAKWDLLYTMEFVVLQRIRVRWGMLVLDRRIQRRMLVHQVVRNVSVLLFEVLRLHVFPQRFPSALRLPQDVLLSRAEQRLRGGRRLSSAAGLI